VDLEPRNGSPAEIVAYWTARAAEAEEEYDRLEWQITEALLLFDLVVCLACILKHSAFWPG